jgi:flagellar protein FlaJ
LQEHKTKGFFNKMKRGKATAEQNGKNHKKTFERQALDLDFFSQLTYMAAISTSGIARGGLFQYASRLPYIAASYFRRADFVARMFNHDYSRACQIIGEKTRETEVKALLLRLSGALSSGEGLPDFLERESDVFSESYENIYERRLEILRRWSDAYIALILTSALVTVMSVVSMMIGQITTSFLVSLASLAIAVTIFGAWFMYHSAPREGRTHSLPYRSKEQNLARSIARITLVVGIIVFISLLMMKVGLSWLMLGTSALILPLGVAAVIDDKKIGDKDTAIAGFLRSLGGVSQATGTTITEAMGRLDLRSLGTLKENVNVLYTRLQAGVAPDLCWQRFVGETGSELVNRTVRIFWDGVSLGGEPQRVGNEASTFANKIALLRAHRKLIASGFTWLTVTMHAMMVILSVFIYHVFLSFSSLFKTLMPESPGAEFYSLPFSGMLSEGGLQTDLLYNMIVAIVIVLSLANAFAIHSASGGHLFKLAFYLSITLAISGGAFMIVPPVVEMIFGIVK